MALKIAYIADNEANPERKLSKKELLHRKAVISLAETRIKDRERAKKMFAPERQRIAKLIEERNALRSRLGKK